MATARAFLWEFRRRHQLGLVVLTVYLLTFLVLQATVLSPDYNVRLNPPNGFAFFVILPGVSMWFYMVGAFTYGLSGDLAARESIYPRRMLTLPVTTDALVGWPMLIGCVSAAALWIVMALFMRAAGAEYPLPLAWPAVLSGLYIAWMQALTWMPYGIPGVRVLVAVFWLFVVDAIVITAFDKQVPDALMLAILLPQLPIAYAVARVAVSRARRGVVPDWTWIWRTPETLVGDAFRRRRSFRSAASAQFWFEWRRSGRALPAMVAIVVPLVMAILFIPGNNTRTPGIVVPFFALLMPPVLAFFSATAFGTPSSFTATRPLNDAALIAAKLKSTLVSTALAWLIALTAIAVAEVWSGASVAVTTSFEPVVEAFGSGRPFIAGGIFFVAILMLSTWRQLVQNLCISLTGNPWLIKSTVLIGLLIMTALGPGLQWFFRDRDIQSKFWNALPLIAIVLVSLKFAAGAVIFSKLHARRVFDDRGLILRSVAWLSGVVVIYAILALSLTDVMTPPYLKATVAILMMPLARLGAAPLALAWSRHR